MLQTPKKQITTILKLKRQKANQSEKLLTPLPIMKEKKHKAKLKKLPNQLLNLNFIVPFVRVKNLDSLRENGGPMIFGRKSYFGRNYQVSRVA